MWILRIDMKSRTFRLEDVPAAYKTLGGRGLTSSIVHDEVPPSCHPLGPNNKLVFAPGLATGTSAPTSARISVGAKSPLTGTIKESNAGSGWAPALAKMRIKALIVEGQPEEPGTFWTVALRECEHGQREAVLVPIRPGPLPCQGIRERVCGENLHACGFDSRGAM